MFRIHIIIAVLFSTLLISEKANCQTCSDGTSCRDAIISADRDLMTGTVTAIKSGAQNDGFYVEILSSVNNGVSGTFWSTDKAALSVFLSAKMNDRKVKVIFLHAVQANYFYDGPACFKLLQVNLM